MMDILYKAGKVDEQTAQAVKQYITNTQIPLPDYVPSPSNDVKGNYDDWFFKNYYLATFCEYCICNL